jgi:hypothetical protein
VRQTAHWSVVLVQRALATHSRGSKAAQCCAHTCALYVRTQSTACWGSGKCRAGWKSMECVTNVACRKLCGQHENVPCANAAAPDSDDDATKPRRAWPHSGYIAATQPRCGVRENRPTRTCTAACRNVGNARDGARTAHRVTRLPGMR